MYFITLCVHQFNMYMQCAKYPLTLIKESVCTDLFAESWRKSQFAYYHIRRYLVCRYLLHTCDSRVQHSLLLPLEA